MAVFLDWLLLAIGVAIAAAAFAGLRGANSGPAAGLCAGFLVFGVVVAIAALRGLV